MDERDFVIRVSRRWMKWMLGGFALVVLILIFSPARAQKIQEAYADKFKVAAEAGGVSVATSADGRYVYVAGKKGIIVSDDYGKTGTWVQTVRLK